MLSARSLPRPPGCCACPGCSHERARLREWRKARLLRRVWRPHEGEPWQQTLVASRFGSRDGSSDSSGGSTKGGGRRAASGVGIKGQSKGEGEDGARHGAAARQAAGSAWGPGPAEVLSEVLEPAADPLILRCLECLEAGLAEGPGPALWGAHTLRNWLTSLAHGAWEGGGDESWIFIHLFCFTPLLKFSLGVNSVLILVWGGGGMWADCLAGREPAGEPAP